MIKLSSILGMLTANLQAHKLCKKVTILETRELSTDQFTFKIRADLISEYRLQIRYYSNFEHLDYAYQLIKADQSIMRWDNKEEFQNLETYPHHYHDPSGNIQPSSLTGTPQNDIIYVLQQLDNFLAASNEK